MSTTVPSSADRPPPAERTAPIGDPVVVLADDLIWSSRLVTQLTSMGARPVPVRSAEAFAAALLDADHAIVDLTARAYDGLAQVAVAAAAGCAVLAVAQHDDVESRRRALASGAQQVHPYRRLFESGPRVLKRWLDAGDPR